MRLSESEPGTVTPPANLGVAPTPLPRPGPVHDAFDALADGYRRELLEMLRDGHRSVNELAANLPISRPAVSRHLKVLTEAGLVTETHAGTRHIFGLRPEGFRAVQEYLERVWGDGATRLRLVPDGMGNGAPAPAAEEEGTF